MPEMAEMNKMTPLRPNSEMNKMTPLRPKSAKKGKSNRYESKAPKSAP